MRSGLQSQLRGSNPSGEVQQVLFKADARKPSPPDMMEQAYILTLDKTMKPVGFVMPVEWRKHNKGEDVVPGGIPDFD